jgi:hypothetical protein
MVSLQMRAMWAGKVVILTVLGIREGITAFGMERPATENG